MDVIYMYAVMYCLCQNQTIIIIIGACVQQKVQADMCTHPRSLITLRWAV